MATIKIARKPKVSVIPSAADSANVEEFEKVAQSLGLDSEEARPRRWLLRIGALLQHVRGHANLKQEQMAQTAGVTQAYLSRLENGLIPKRGPTIEVLLRCAEAANCHIEIAVRSRKDNKLLGTVSSKDLDESEARARSSIHSGQPVRANPADIVNVIFEPDRTDAERQRGAPTTHRYEDDLTEPIKKIEQAQASLAIILKAFNAALKGPHDALGRIVKVKAVDLETLSGQAATDLVQALEVVWPYRREKGLTTLTGHGVQKNNTVKVGAGHLVVIGGADPSAAAGSVRVLGAAELVKGESDA